MPKQKKNNNSKKIVKWVLIIIIGGGLIALALGLLGAYGVKKTIDDNASEKYGSSGNGVDSCKKGQLMMVNACTCGGFLINGIYQCDDENNGVYIKTMRTGSCGGKLFLYRVTKQSREKEYDYTVIHPEINRQLPLVDYLAYAVHERTSSEDISQHWKINPKYHSCSDCGHKDCDLS